MTTGIVLRPKASSPSTSPKSFSKDVIKIILPDINAACVQIGIMLRLPILNKDGSGKAQANIILQRNDSTPNSPGNYTLGISATNGIVTKLIFRYLFVK
jgi:hypothetical protein